MQMSVLWGRDEVRLSRVRGVFPGTNDFRLILRPIITVRIVGRKADARWDALVDSGADETLFPLSLAEALGVELDQQMTSEAAGISGYRLKIHYGDVELRIESDQEFVAWKTTVGFVDFGSASDEVIILGHGVAWISLLHSHQDKPLLGVR
ncbi:MAG TPA: hypothetical protein VMM76_16840 [Pirellulaceae bacterium]|nr:hypothetical protein [Pirellulaceae bacterium]